MALERVNWLESTKEEVRAVLLPECTSLDESQHQTKEEVRTVLLTEYTSLDESQYQTTLQKLSQLSVVI